MLGKLAYSFGRGESLTSALRNRGRSRQWIAAAIERHLHTRWQKLQQGDWKPSSATVPIGPPVSLTSWKPRLPDLPLTLISLISQSPRPNRVFVWLTPMDLNALDSATARHFEPHGVQFLEAPELGPHKKWHSMATSQREPFVICDDDTFYPPTWYASMVSVAAHAAYVGCRCHRIVGDQQAGPAPYAQWEKEIKAGSPPAHTTFITGVGGAVIHPQRLPARFLEPEAFMRLCPRADDIWLKLAHLVAGIPCVRSRFTFPCLGLAASEASGLAAENVTLHGNDRQLAESMSAFRINPASLFQSPSAT